MEVIPSYEEYAHSKKEHIVKTAEGEYFAITNFEIISKRVKRATVLCSLLFGAGMLALQISSLVWPMIFIDFSIATGIFTACINHTGYRHAKFEKIKPDDTGYAVVKQLRFRKSYPTLRRIFYGLIIITVMLQSYTMACVHSVIENDARITSVEISSNRKVLYTGEGLADGTAYVTLYAQEMQSIVIEADAERAPSLIWVTLDSKSITKSVYRHFVFNWFWEETYLNQEVTIFILHNPDIHDGSVLEMTCGSLYRRWVFHLTEEGA